MKISTRVATLAIALAGAAPTSALATINGWFDYAETHERNDYERFVGWICDTGRQDLYPADVKLVVYSWGPAGDGVLMLEVDASTPQNTWPGSQWGHVVPGVEPWCNGSANVGFQISGWFGSPSFVYYKDSSGVLHLLGGSPKSHEEGDWRFVYP